MIELSTDAYQVLEDLGMSDAERIELAAAIERARVVGVLDEWQAQSGGRQVNLVRAYRDRFVVLHLAASMTRRFMFEGADADAARAAAAKAIEAGEV